MKPIDVNKELYYHIPYLYEMKMVNFYTLENNT